MIFLHTDCLTELESTPECQKILNAYHKARDLQARPSFERHKEVLFDIRKVQAYRVYHHFFYFLGPIWMRSYQNIEKIIPGIIEKNFLAYARYCNPFDCFEIFGHSVVTAIVDTGIAEGEKGDDFLRKLMSESGISALLRGTVSII